MILVQKENFEPKTKPMIEKTYKKNFINKKINNQKTLNFVLRLGRS